MANCLAIRIAQALHFTPGVNISVTLSGASVIVGNTVQATAIAHDANGNPIALPAGGFTSSDPTNASVNSSTGVVTGNGVTTASIIYTVTGTGVTGSAPLSVTSPAPSVTAVSLWYTGVVNQNVSASGGMLLWTGQAYQLTVQDQAGNVLSPFSGNFSSSDATNFPVTINGGLISPNAGVGGGTITFTHTASNKSAVVNISVLVTPGAIFNSDGGANYANTTALMLAIRNTVSTDGNYTGPGAPGPGYPKPQSTSGWVYGGNSTYVNHYSIDSGAGHLFMGAPAIVDTLSTTTPPVTAILNTINNRSNTAPSFTRAWGLVISRFDPGFTMIGSGAGAHAFKVGNWFGFSPGGRVGPEMTNGTSNTGTGGGPGGAFDHGCLMQNGGASVGGAPTSITGTVTTEFALGEVWCSLVLYETRGGNIMSSRIGYWKIGQVPNLTWGNSYSTPVFAVEGPMVGSPPQFVPPKPASYQPGPANYNNAPPFSQIQWAMFQWYWINGDTQGDPFGVLGAQPSPTLTSVSGGTFAVGDIGTVLTLTGTGFNLNCDVTISNPGVFVRSIDIVNSTSMQVTVTTGLTVSTGGAATSTGAATILVTNKVSAVASATQPLTVNALANAPDAPTALNANAHTSTSLTFKVTPASTGPLLATSSLPSAFAVQYSINGGSSYTAGSDIALPNPEPGSVTSQVITGLTTGQAYLFQFAEKNAIGQSAWSNAVSGTPS